VLSYNGISKKLDPSLQVGTLYWDTCTMPRDMWHCIGIHDVALGSMYLYLIISSCIGIYVIYLGIHVLHWDTCSRIRIYDNASNHDRDMSSHLPHGPLRVFLLTQLGIVITLVHFYSLLGPYVRDFYTFEETIIGCWSSFKWLGWPLGDVALTTLIFLRNAHIEPTTHDTYHWILYWMSHTYKGVG